MATYLQGVTDYIPQFQPFQPDLNFYNSVLQTKQTQYDSNYKELNKVYGQYLYADLTHGENIQRKEELLKNIDVSLKKVSGLDLSLEQNVTQAVQVFKPFYEDNYLMKDMAWTKNFSNQKGRAEGLKNSLDEKQRAMYWNDGVVALDYKREEFKESSLADTLNIESPSYTNYVNVQEKALKLAKDSDLSIESVDFSEDGKWIVKTKNGQQLEEPLSKLFEASLGSDPAIMEMYKTQSYVNRKNYSYSNAAQFGGDKNAAEMNYLETHFNRLKDEQIARNKQLQNTSNVYTTKIKDLESQISKGNKNPKLVQELENLKQGKDINDSVLTRVQKDIDMMSEGTRTATTSTGKENPFGDIKSLRYKIDNSIASSLMEKDLNEAAHVFAYRNAKKDVEANPYAILDVKHQYDMQNTALRNQGLANAAKIRVKGDKEINMDKALVEDGSHHWDLDPNSETYGRAVINEDLIGTKVRKDNLGNVTGALNAKKLTNIITEEKTKTYAIEGVNKMNELIDKYVSTNLMTEDQANAIYGSGWNPKLKGMTRKQFAERLAKNPNYFLNKTVGSASLEAITARFNGFMKKNANISTVNKDMSTWSGLGQKLEEFNSYQKINEDYLKKNSKTVESILKNEGFDKSYLLYDEKGNKRSEQDYIDLRKKSGAKQNVIKRPTQIQIGEKTVTVTNDNYESVIKLAGEEKLNLLSKGSWDFQKGQNLPIETQRKYNLAPSKLYVKSTKDGQPFYTEYNEKNKDKIIDNLGRQSLTSMFGKNIPQTGELTFKDEYIKLNKAADKAWKSSKIETPVAIDITGIRRNEGTGLYTTGVTTIGVNHRASTTPGYRYWHQIKGDLNGIDFGDPSSVQTSFTGATVTGLSKSSDKFSGDDLTKGTNSKTQIIVNGLMQQSESMKSGLKNFTVGAQRVAANDPNKSAIIIYPTKEFLEGYVKGVTEKNPSGTGSISQSEMNDMLQNGISIVQNSKNWTNQLSTKGSMTPLEAVVDYTGNYEYKDMYGNGFATIEKNIYGSSRFKITVNNQIMDPETGEMVDHTEIGYTNQRPDEFITDVQRGYEQLNQFIQQ